VARGATTVVLSQGMNKQLHVHPDTRRYLDERSITVHVAETREAAKIYSDLAEGTLVAGLFHSTCYFRSHQRARRQRQMSVLEARAPHPYSAVISAQSCFSSSSSSRSGIP
jgi:hypothetical protein